MYEICNFMAANYPVKKKPRKPSGPRIKVGAKVVVYSFGVHSGVVAGKNANGSWNVTIDSTGVTAWFDRSLIEVVKE